MPRKLFASQHSRNKQAPQRHSPSPSYQNTSSKAKGIGTTKLLSSSGEKLTALHERHGLEFGRCGSEGIKGLVKDVRKQAQIYLKSADICESLGCMNQVSTLI
jgi:hypothetical protein